MLIRSFILRSFGFLFSACLATSGMSQAVASDPPGIEEKLLDYELNGSEGAGIYAAMRAQLQGNQPAIDRIVAYANKTRTAESYLIAGFALSSGPTAIEYYTKARALGKKEAAGYIALVYFYGNGVAENKKMACELLREAVTLDLGDSYAGQYAECHNSIQKIIPGFYQSLTESCKWYGIDATRLWGEYKKSPDSKYLKSEVSRSYVKYGLCLSENGNENKNIAASTEWLRASADLGNFLGSFLYGERLSDGIGTVQDNKNALKMFGNAAEGGVAVAQNRLGLIFAEGKLVKKNMNEAYKWFLIASANGYEPALENKNKAEKMLPSVDVQKGQQQAKNWVEKHGLK